MHMNENVAAWLKDAPQEVTQATHELLGKVEQMRDEQVIYPPQEDILNALAAPSSLGRTPITAPDRPWDSPSRSAGARDSRLAYATSTKS